MYVYMHVVSIRTCTHVRDTTLHTCIHVAGSWFMGSRYIAGRSSLTALNACLQFVCVSML